MKCLYILILAVLCLAAVAQADGNIDPVDKYAWAEATGWANFSPTHGGVTVHVNGTNGYLEGDAWFENIGFVHLGAGSGPYANTASNNYGVNMDASGNLSGFAWSRSTGWMNFNPTHSQVTIDTFTGDFDGHAWGENIGYVQFQGVSPDYKVRTTVFNPDFGDLPPSYGITLLATDGARHIPGNVYLGISVDIEDDGLESAAADGDDVDGIDDEDGIAVSGSWRDGTNAGAVEVTVAGNSGYLSAWIDWAGNNQFTDAGDPVLNMASVSSGTQTVYFDIPPGAIPTSGTYTNFARFRLCTNGTPGLTLTGLVHDGEVEDHRLVYTGLPPSTTTVELDGGGNLVITDTSGEDNQIGVRVDGAYLVITDPNSVLACTIPGALGNGTCELRVPLSAITGTVLFHGTSGNDAFIIDGTSGNPLLTGATYDGGAGGNDTLTIVNMSGDVEIDLGASGSGSVTCNGSLLCSFANLEPIDLTGSAIQNLTVNVDPSDAVDGAITTTLRDHANPGVSELTFTGGLEDILFGNPSVSLTVNGDATDADIVNVEGVDAAWTADLTIDGHGGGDTVNFQDAAAPPGDAGVPPPPNGVPVTLGGGSLAVTGEVINISQPVTTVGNGSVSLTAITNIACTSGGGISVVDGSLTLTANGAGTASGNTSGILVSSATVGATGSGTILLDGTGAGTGAGIRLAGAGTMVGGATAAGDISLVTDSLLATAGSIQSTGALTIKPKTPGATIGLGGGAGTLSIDDTELGLLADGFSSIAVGDAAAGTVDVDSATLLDPVTIAGAAITDHSGTDLTAPAVTLAAAVNPGQSPGILNINGNATVGTNETFTVELGGTTPGTGAGFHDQLAIVGTVTIGTGVTLDPVLFGGFSPTLGDAFTIVDNDDADAVSGTFEYGGLPLNDEDQFIDGDAVYGISYDSGDGNDVVLAAESPDTVYVDDSFMQAHGGSIADADLGTAGNQPAVMGVNAFATLGAGLSAVATNGTIIVNGGAYAESIALGDTRTMEITGPDAAQAVVIDALSGIAGTTITIEGASTLTLGDATDRVLAGSVNGPGALVKQGGGRLTLQGGGIQFSGDLTVNQGSATLADATNFANGADPELTLTVAGGATLEFDVSVDHRIGTSGGTGTGITITGTGTLLKTGAGRLDFGDQGSAAYRVNMEMGANALIDVREGTIRNGGWQGQTWSSNLADLNVDAGATFDIWDGISARVDAVNGTGTITRGIGGGGDVSTFIVGVDDGSGDFSGLMGIVANGRVHLQKEGSGTQTLSGTLDNNSLTATVNTGTLGLAKASSGAVHALGGSGTVLTVNSGAIARLAGSGGDQVYLAGDVIVNGGGLFDQNGTSEGIDALSGGGTVDNIDAAPATLTIGQGDGGGNFSGIFQDTGGNLRVVKTGTADNAVFSGVANTHEGGTEINQGVLRAVNDGSLGSVNGALTLRDGGVMQNNNSVVALDVNRTVTLANGNGAFRSGWGKTITVNGPITGPGNLRVVNDGAAIILTNPANDYDGDTIVGGDATVGGWGGGGTATLRLGAANVIPNGAGKGNVLFDSATQNEFLDLNGFDETVNGLSRLTGSAFVQNSTGSATLSVGDNDATGTFDGVMRDNGGTLALTKIGDGTLTLSGADTYTGNTSVDDGVLQIGGGGTINAASAIAINADGPAAGDPAILRLSRHDIWGNHATTASSQITVHEGGSLETDNSFNTLVDLALDGGTVLLNGGANPNYPALALKGTVSVTADSAINVGAGANNIISIGITAAPGATTFDVSASAALVNNAPLKNNRDDGGAAEQPSQLVKTGDGTLQLVAACTYSGTTTVDGGVLQVDNVGGSATGSGNVAVNAGATLSGDGVEVSVVPERTLTVVSAYGTATPAVGTHTNLYGDVLTNSVTSPVTSENVEYVCTGWAMVGNAAGSGATNEMTMVHTNDATLTWLWQTNALNDFGDLPAAYAVTRVSENGARHFLPGTGGVLLGVATDPETNGLPSAAAAGDDTDGTDDEDGIAVVGGWQEGVSGGAVEIVVSGGSGYLSGWIDWDGNNQFTDVGDQVFDMEPVTTGVQTNTFAVPAGIFTNSTTYLRFARFRLWTNSAPALALTGLVFNGEVEDYELQIVIDNVPPVVAGDTTSAVAQVAAVIDVLGNDTDADGDPLTITNVTQGARGSVTINAGNTNVTYTANAGEAGYDQFTYWVSDGQGGWATGLVTVAVDPQVTYVWAGGSNTWPYADWSMAANDIQTAVDAVVSSGMVWVTNGTYSAGGATVDGMPCRVALTKPVTVRSVNGETVTVIAGQGPVGLAAVRCLYMTNGAALFGFTLQDGATRGFGNNDGIINRSGPPPVHIAGIVEEQQSGGGVRLHNGGVLSNCVVQGNSAFARGGGIWCDGGGMVYGCTIVNNAASLGGGASLHDGSLIACHIIANVALTAGGGGHSGSPGLIRNCVVVSNSAPVGGGISLVSTGAVSATIQNCTIASNTATLAGGGLNCDSLQAPGPAVVNTIIYYNEAPVSQNWVNIGPAAFTNACTTPTNGLPGPGHIDAEPLFSRITGGGYHLRASSPCKNTGLNGAWMTGNVDIEGNARIIAAIVDRGAFEYPNATDVVLYEFWLTQNNGQVVVHWQTASEIGTVGFQLYRKVGGDWVLVNTDGLIPARGAPLGGVGASYAYVDTGADPSVTHTYKLVEITLDGNEEYGPFKRSAYELRLVSPLTVLPGGGVAIRWLSRAGDLYRVYSSPNLLGDFVPLSGALPATPPENVYTDRRQRVGTRYYQVRMEE